MLQSNRRRCSGLIALSLWLSSHAFAEQPNPRVLAEPWKSYFEKQVAAIEGQLDREIKTKEDWLAKKGEYRRELAEMLGLDPLPPRTDLNAVKTGEFEQDGVIVENIHFQSMPGLYVTANLYRPKQVLKPLPTILYGCGHANMMKDGVSYGNKTGYEHHGMWYAKHGFVCLIFDTVQLGEIRGEHHGTYDKGLWWWFSRGYTPAGVEAWAGIRALDYLETRPEVDKTRFGVTGRSGGGAYSWWIAALDERIKAAAPTAGITTLRNHVMTGCVAGHCDCMYMVNTYRWDYDKVAALVAPRPLLIANTDKDDIFPIDGVFKIYQSARRIYALLDAEKNIGMQFAEGPHADTQPLNTGEFHWMVRMLQGADRMATLDAPAVKSIPMEKLRVFNALPTDERNTRIDESFVSMAKAPEVPANSETWNRIRDGWMKALKEKSFSSQFTPQALAELEATTVEAMPTEAKDGFQITPFRIRSSQSKETDGNLSLLLIHDAAVGISGLERIVLHVDDGLNCGTPSRLKRAREELVNSKTGTIYFFPRGEGTLALPDDIKVRTHLLRRFYLVGETLESCQVFDVRCAIRAIRKIDHLKDIPLGIKAGRAQSINALYASLIENNIAELDLTEVPHSHAHGPALLSVLRFIDIPEVVAMAAERSRVVIHESEAETWNFPLKTSNALGWLKNNSKGLELCFIKGIQ